MSTAVRMMFAILMLAYGPAQKLPPNGLPDTLNRFQRWWSTPVQLMLLFFGLVNAGVPLSAIGPGTMYVVARTSSDPAALAQALTREARAIEPNVPVFDVKTMEQRLADSMARRRFAMLMLGLFALVAMLLAAVGIYGVMSQLVLQTTHDIGVRMAVGASPRAVLGMVLASAMGMAGDPVWRAAAT